MTVGERIKQVRHALKMTQQAFAERLRMKRNSIAQVEGGRSTSEQTIGAICREFDVNETWLRTGEGEMFVQLSDNEKLERQIRELLKGGNDSFRERMIALLLQLKTEQWEAIEHYALQLLHTRDQPSADAAPSPPTDSSPSNAELVARLDALEQENEKLRQRLENIEKEEPSREEPSREEQRQRAIWFTDFGK